MFRNISSFFMAFVSTPNKVHTELSSPNPIPKIQSLTLTQIPQDIPPSSSRETSPKSIAAYSVDFSSYLSKKTTLQQESRLTRKRNTLAGTAIKELEEICGVKLPAAVRNVVKKNAALLKKCLEKRIAKLKDDNEAEELYRDYDELYIQFHEFSFGDCDDSYGVTLPTTQETREKILKYLSASSLTYSRGQPKIALVPYFDKDIEFDKMLVDNFTIFSGYGELFKDLKTKYDINFRLRQIKFLRRLAEVVEDIINILCD